jgi:hypothetical protein
MAIKEVPIVAAVSEAKGQRNSYMFPFHRRSRSLSPPKVEEEEGGSAGQS